MATSGHFVTLKAVIDALVAPPAPEWTRFQALFEPQTLQAGQFFIRAGDPSTRICFINAGLLRLFYQTPQGKEFNKSFAQENSFAGVYSAYLSDSPARFAIQALEDSRLLVAAFPDITGLFNGHRCWEKLGRLLSEQLYVKKEQREAEFLLDDAQTRYRNFQNQYPGLEDRLPQYHVASYLGITPVALSRIRNAESG